MHAYESEFREPLINGMDKNYTKITDDLVAPTERNSTLWWIMTLLTGAGTAFFVFCLAWTVWFGIGTWGLNKTIGWAWDITNFVWWIGIGHAGTLISAILLLFRQRYRTGINRAAEAMTIFAVICAGMFPIFHMGRVWDAPFIFPLPNTRGPLWVNFNSPLLWDVFAISTYFSVSLLFWYSGLMPDFGTVRDRAKGKFRKWMYNILSFGWSGSAKQWQRFESLALVLSGLSTPLVLSVHTIVSFDFATSVIPGWHTTIFPLPNTRGPLWVNFNSPLLWDVFAISTYFSVSLLFWYSGLMPDFGTVRDRAKGKFRKWMYNILSFGWSGSAKQWQRFESLALVLSGLSTPLVLSVHTIVSFDFATSVIPGWHTTIFPPYFVAGAIFSGFAMVETLMLISRKVFNLEDYITINHIESMNKIIVLTGSIVGIAYLTELFIAWYSGFLYEQFAFYNRILGKYLWAYALMMSCNVLSPQLYWFKSMRRNLYVTFILSIFVNIGMWFERFVIIVTSLADDYLPSSWAYFSPTWVDIGIYTGSISVFLFLFLLFSRFFPTIAIAEVKSIFRTSSEVAKAERAKKEGAPHGGFVGLQTVGPLDKDAKN